MGRRLRLLALSLFCLAAPAWARPPAPTDAFPDIARAYWLEIDGRPVWAGQPELRLPMASLTKLMTALVLAESADLEAMVRIGSGVASETGTRIGLRPGEQVRAGDLFDAMLIRSANDACRALADWHAGDQVAFVALMNARAEALGLRDTHFGDACGHDRPDQYSSARDLATLAHAVLAVPRIADTVAREEHRFSTAAGRHFHVRNTNALLGRLEGARGLKTGYTPGAGRCLIAVTERGGRQVLLVLLHAPDRWWDAAGLIELAFEEARRLPAP